MRRCAFFTACAAALVLIALATTGCSKTVTVTVPSTSPSSSPPVTVSVIEFRYSPVEATIVTGTRVTWVNSGSTSHTVTSDTQLFDSGQMAPGAKFSFTFDAVGTYGYHDSNYPDQMTGTIAVLAPGANPPSSTQPASPVPTPQPVPGPSGTSPTVPTTTGSSPG